MRREIFQKSKYNANPILCQIVPPIRPPPSHPIGSLEWSVVLAGWVESGTTQNVAQTCSTYIDTIGLCIAPFSHIITATRRQPAKESDLNKTILQGPRECGRSVVM